METKLSVVSVKAAPAVVQKKIDLLFMQRALELAVLGRGQVSPNPMVGCVIATESGQIIGEGWHQQYGQAHAEVNAIRSVSSANRFLLPTSTAYVTLEPCSHFGKTPPCADLLIAENVARVVVGNDDPNPLVAGRGLQKLRDAGIEVETGLLAEIGRHLNRRFFTFFEQKRPYITLKWAETADGFIAQSDGKPLVVSSLLSRTRSHQWRSQEDAILVGTNTAQNDNPRLNVRLWTGRNPLRIVLDPQNRLPKHLHLFDQSQPTLRYETTDLSFILGDLYQRKVQSILVEGGAKLLQSFLNQGLFDEIRVFKSLDFVGEGIAAPMLPSNLVLRNKEKISTDWLYQYTI